VSTLVTELPRGRVTLPHVLLSEWTKLRSVRSTRWSFFTALLLTIGIPVLVSFITRSHWSHMSPHEQADRHPLDVALVGTQIAQLAIGVLGVLVISAEYSTGMIRASMTAVPRRLPVLWAKTAVFAAFTFVLMLPAVLLAFFLSQSILRAHHILEISFTHPGVARTVCAGAVFLALIGVFALGLGAIVRNTAGGIALFAAILFVIPPLLLLLPSSWNDAISPYLPSNAAESIITLSPGSGSLSPWVGFFVLLGYAAASIAVAAALLVRRDT
jgi:ABC-type transport system involved in multi-copper enzyme maturation permease subunit